MDDRRNSIDEMHDEWEGYDRLGWGKKEYAQEEQIVWTMPIEGLDFVRESSTDTYSRTGPTLEMVGGGVLVGYSELRADAEPAYYDPEEMAYVFERRSFYLHSYDLPHAYTGPPNGFYVSEAVDPKMIKAGKITPRICDLWRRWKGKVG